MGYTNKLLVHFELRGAFVTTVLAYSGCLDTEYHKSPTRAAASLRLFPFVVGLLDATPKVAQHHKSSIMFFVFLFR